MGPEGRAALVRFLEQMRGVCFIIESRSDSPCLCFAARVCGTRMQIFNNILLLRFCTVIPALSQGKARVCVCVLSVRLSVPVWVYFLFVPVSL